MSETVTTAPAARSPRRRLELRDGPPPAAILPGCGLAEPAEFTTRHIGLSAADEAAMLAAIGAGSLEALLDEIVPESIRRHETMRLPPAVSEATALEELRGIAARNRVLRSFIGQGYHGTRTPPVILRNVLEKGFSCPSEPWS